MSNSSSQLIDLLSTKVGDRLTRFFNWLKRSLSGRADAFGLDSWSRLLLDNSEIILERLIQDTLHRSKRVDSVGVWNAIVRTVVRWPTMMFNVRRWRCSTMSGWVLAISGCMCSLISLNDHSVKEEDCRQQNRLFFSSLAQIKKSHYLYYVVQHKMIELTRWLTLLPITD